MARCRVSIICAAKASAVPDHWYTDGRGRGSAESACLARVQRDASGGHRIPEQRRKWETFDRGVLFGGFGQHQHEIHGFTCAANLWRAGDLRRTRDGCE